MLCSLVMHIYFIGQKGIPAQRIEDSAEVRAEILASEAVKNGHIVTVSSTPSYTKQEKIRSYFIELLHIPSFNPRVAGGHLYTFLSCASAVFIRPDTIHVQGWKAAFILRIFLPLLPRTITIWTISTLPPISNSFSQRIFKQLLHVVTSGFDAIHTPNRTVQYRLLMVYSLKSEYIPDGYTVPLLPEIRPATFGFRKEQYGVILCNNMTQIRQISYAFKQLKTTKKLILFSPEVHRGVKSLDLPLTSRSAQSLIRQAAFIIAAKPTYSPLTLQAMDAGRMILATTDPLHEELFGVTAKYYQENDMVGLQKLLKEAIKPHILNKAAQMRAKNYFQWEKIGQEYIRAYRHPKTILVPFDSIIRKNNFQRAL